MRIKTMAVFSVVFSLALMPALTAVASEVADEISRHEALAVSYEQKVSQQDALIAENESMKADALKAGTFNPKVGPSLDYRKMKNHCDKLIQSAKGTKEELAVFAKYHKMRIEELQGK